MSFTASPVLDRWNKEEKNWHYTFQPAITPFQIPPNSFLLLPTSAPATFLSVEGTLINFGACFDNPLCGIRLETTQGIDTAYNLTIANSLVIGLQPQGLPITVAVPPATSPGLFCVNVSKEFLWKNWCRLYVFNSDAVVHNCLIVAYLLAMLDK